MCKYLKVVRACGSYTRGSPTATADAPSGSALQGTNPHCSGTQDKGKLSWSPAYGGRVGVRGFAWEGTQD